LPISQSHQAVITDPVSRNCSTRFLNLTMMITITTVIYNPTQVNKQNLEIQHTPQKNKVRTINLDQNLDIS